jgi:hypothetical protein
MYPFLDTQLNTLLGLINQSNPGLKVQLTSSMLGSLVPTAVTPGTGQIQDTSLRLLAQQGNSGHYIGLQTVFYRRINLGNLYRNMVLTLSNYIGSTTMTAAQFVTAFNAQYGTELVTSDFTNTSFTSGTQTTVAMVATSLCYSGSITVKWTQGVPALQQRISTPVLTGKLYPGGNTFGGARKPQGDVLTYGLNCTSVAAALKGLAASIQVTPALWGGAGSNYASILAFLQQSIPGLNFNGTDQANAGGLGNLFLTRLTLPSASAPGANSAAYGFVTLIPAVSTSWFQGQLYLHYN